MTVHKPNAARRLLYLLVTLGWAVSSPAADKELLDILLLNGAINQTQYDSLIKKEAIDADDVEEIVTKLDSGGLRVETADGDFSFKLGTRLHAEASTHSGSLPDGSSPVNGTELRRARFETSGKFDAHWNWAAEVDFADDATAVKDFRIGYKGDGNSRIDFGHQKQPYSLALEMSSNDLPFIERSVDNYLVVPFVDRAIGVRAESSGEKWFIAVGAFGDAVGPGSDTGAEGWGVSGRFVYAPILREQEVLHLGVRAALREPSRAERAVRIRDETTHFSNLRIVDTGLISDVDRANITGLEAAYARGPFSLVGEYSLLDTQRSGESTLSFDSWNVYGTWSLTGESRVDAYKLSSGEFKRLEPAQVFSTSEGTWGAWELALRYATIDLNDGAFVGGSEDVVSTGLNWYLNHNMRLMLEWSRIVETDGSSELRRAADGLDIFQFRTQYTF